ncbi:DUF2795 domain-containing protein [Fundidesulfovibrio putealis]|uniref:DUF2795 domain-containing protein n=1 Tax=Fundidesulfovibrio putealis TaxID=270496 RepID=UPI0005B9355D|nr:DUF2795 domain-containing protein [Fundidesulfovibrio putealis]
MPTASKASRTNETQADDLLGSGSLNGDQNLHSANMSKYIRWIAFPASEADILRQAKQNGADETVLGLIKIVPERRYASRAELMVEFGERE